MQDLQLVGVHDDGEHLLLTAADGQRYRLAIDEPLRAAVRRDRARLGQLQIQIEGALRPKDIQARIRSGQTADDVAAAAGLPVEHVRRYEGPVLAEREHVAQLAQRQQIRGTGPGRGLPLGALVTERLALRGVSDTGTWDAWRRDDGTWTIQLAFRAGSKDRRAKWAFDVTRSTLEPVDDESRWLSAAEAEDEGPIPARRLSSVKERVYDVEADGGVREARRRAAGSAAAGSPRQDPQSESPPDPPIVPAPAVQTIDLLEELRGRRGRRQPAMTPQELAEADSQGEADAEPELPPAAHPPASRPQDALDAEILALPEAAGSDHDDAPAGDETRGAAEATDDAEPLGDAPAAPRPRRQPPKGKSKARRPSVPSWDEIVFGGKKE